jgi:hypothetical protein
MDTQYQQPVNYDALSAGMNSMSVSGATSSGQQALYGQQPAPSSQYPLPHSSYYQPAQPQNNGNSGAAPVPHGVAYPVSSLPYSAPQSQGPNASSQKPHGVAYPVSSQPQTGHVLSPSLRYPQHTAPAAPASTRYNGPVSPQTTPVSPYQYPNQPTPASSYAAPTAQSNYPAPVAQSGYPAPVAQSGYSAPVAQSGYPAQAASSSYSPPAPNQPSHSLPAAQSDYPAPTQDSYSPAAAQSSSPAQASQSVYSAPVGQSNQSSQSAAAAPQPNAHQYQASAPGGGPASRDVGPTQYQYAPQRKFQSTNMRTTRLITRKLEHMSPNHTIRAASLSRRRHHMLSLK